MKPTSPFELEDYRFEEDIDCPYCEIGGVERRRRGLHWHRHWDRVGTWEYVTIGAATAVGLTAHFLVPSSDEPSWTRPILFDQAARDILVFDSARDRDTAKKVSDWLAGIAIVQPVVIDSMLIAWWGRDSGDVAYQMLVINAQAYSLTFGLNSLTKRLTNRARPRVQACEAGETDEGCNVPGRYRSFYSGHSALTATGAGLVCAHHTQLMLYDDPVLDSGACVAAVLGTAATGALRISSDNHWASDVVIGHLAGYLSGYLLPTLLYYKEFSFVPREHEPEGPTFAVLPQVTDDSVGVAAFGVF